MRTRTTGQNPSQLVQQRAQAQFSAKRVSNLPYEPGSTAAAYGTIIPQEAGAVVGANPYMYMAYTPSGKYGSITDDISGVRAYPHLRSCSHEQIEWQTRAGVVTQYFTSTGRYGVRDKSQGMFTPPVSYIEWCTPLWVPSANDKNAVRARFTAGEYSGSNLTEFFAELDEVSHLWNQTAEKLVTILSSGGISLVRSASGKIELVGAFGARYKRMRLMHAVNDLSLIYQWAIAPIISDLKTIAGGLERLRSHQAKLHKRQGEILRVRAVGGDKYTASLSASSCNDVDLNGWYWADYAGSVRQRWKYCITGYYRIPTAVPDTIMGELSRWILGHGGSQPLTSVWNTMRLSFAIDWFLPIGHWLSQFRTPSAGFGQLEYLGATESTLCEADGQVEMSLVPNRGGGAISGLFPQRVVEGESGMTVTRRSYSRSPISCPSDTNLPRFKLPNVGQTVSLLQLVYSKVGPRKPR